MEERRKSLSSAQIVTGRKDGSLFSRNSYYFLQQPRLVFL